MFATSGASPGVCLRSSSIISRSSPTSSTRYRAVTPSLCLDVSSWRDCGLPPLGRPDSSNLDNLESTRIILSLCGVSRRLWDSMVAVLVVSVVLVPGFNWLSWRASRRCRELSDVSVWVAALVPVGPAESADTGSIDGGSIVCRRKRRFSSCASASVWVTRVAARSGTGDERYDNGVRGRVCDSCVPRGLGCYMSERLESI